MVTLFLFIRRKHTDKRLHCRENHTTSAGYYLSLGSENDFFGAGVYGQSAFLQNLYQPKKYSQYALESILAEYVAKEFDLEALCFAFVGKSSIIGHSDLACLMRASGILEGNHAKCLSLLIDLSFLGLEVQKDDFRFIYEKSDLRKYEVMAKLYVNETKAEPRYKVNPPFLPYLDMQ